MLPGWLVFSLCAGTLLVIAWHVLSVQRSAMPRVRKRLRICSGILMMFISTLLAYALGVAPVLEHPRQNPDASKVFVIVWIVVVGLLAIVVVLAVLDALMTVSAGAAARRRLHEEFAAGRAGQPRGADTSGGGPTRG